MPNSDKRVPRPGINPGAKNRETPTIKAFQQSNYDIIYPEGEIITIDSDIQAGYIVRQGSVAVEMIITAPGGLKKIDLDTVEAGEYFNIHSLFGFKDEGSTDLRYRAQCRTTIMRVTKNMLPQDPQKLSVILRSFMQTAARREGKLRQLTGYALQRAEEKHADRTGGNSQLLDKYRKELEARGHRITELEQALAKRQTNSQVQSLAESLTELENANAALHRDKLSLENDARALQSKLEMEARTRAALELRNSELTQQLAAQSSATSSAKFPSASLLLESSELNELESDAKRFHEAAKHFESLATMMQRAMELLAQDNPGMTVSEDVMMLMLGEEPPARPSVEKARARRDSKDFKTVHLGSESPEVAAALAQERAPRPKTIRDSDRIDTQQETPFAKRGPDSLPSNKLPHKQTDRNIAPRVPQTTDVSTPKEQSPNHIGPLSDKDVSSILEEFVLDSVPPNAPSSSGVNVPYPELGDTWDSESDTGSRSTRPFIPKEGELATNSEVDFPPDPPTPHLGDPSRIKTPIDGARRAANISGRYLQPADHGSGFPPEADSDITPVVNEFPPDEPPSFRSPASSRTRGWDGNTYSARPDDIPTHREGSGSKHSAVTFPDEGTDVRQIQEEWRNKLRQPNKPSEPKEFAIPSSTQVPAPPANLFGEIEPVQPPSSLRDLVNDEEADPSELSDDIDWVDQPEDRATQAYRFDDPPSSKKTEDDIRSTRAYEFPAPGKPPKPGS